MNMEKEELESIMKYFDISDKDEAEKIKIILDELKNYGEWGSKVSSYFSSILSGTQGDRSLIDPEKIMAFKSLFIINNDDEKEQR